ncbi:MAG: hypothetical protein RIF33_26875 [Cyclobacteriaceae bacterium]
MEGKVPVEYISKLEDFQNSFDHVFDRLDLPHIHVEHSNRTNKIHYSEINAIKIRLKYLIFSILEV